MSYRPVIPPPSCSRSRITSPRRPIALRVRASELSIGRWYHYLPPSRSEPDYTRTIRYNDAKEAPFQRPCSGLRSTIAVGQAPKQLPPVPPSRSIDREETVDERFAALKGNHKKADVEQEPGFKLRRYIAFDAESDNGDSHTTRTGHDYVQTTGLYRSWFTVLDSLFERLLRTHPLGVAAQRKHFGEQAQFAQEFLSDLSSTQLREKWASLPIGPKLDITPYLIIGSLVHSVRQALFVLSNLDFIWDDFRVRMRCLSYMHATSKSRIRRSSDLHKDFEMQVKRCTIPETWPETQLKTVYIDLMLEWSQASERGVLIHDVLTKYPFVQSETYSIILNHYNKSHDVDGALDFLSKIPESVLQCPSIEMRRDLTNLLRLDTIEVTDKGSNFKILPHLLRLGVEPSPEVYSIVLRNAVKQNLYNVAWDLYHYLRDQAIEVDARCYLLLLKDAFSRGYVQGLNEVMTDIHDSESLGNDPYLVVYSMNIVRVVSFFRLKASTTEALTRIMGLYDRAWSRQALKPFRILSKVNEPIDKPALPSPPAASLAFTLWSYILVQRSERVVDNLWQRVTQLINEADAKTLQPFQREIVYNGFVLFYARKLSTLVQALKVVQFMLDHDLCKPSPRTWSLLVCGFLKHRQLDQAANVVRMMEARGMKLDYISEQHLPHEYSLTDLEPLIEHELDETQLPDGIEALMAEPLSNDDLKMAREEEEAVGDLRLAT